MNNYKDRLDSFKKLLDGDLIDIQKLKKMCFNGIPDEQGIRAVCWRIFLSLLPCEKNFWEETLLRNRNLYAQLTEEILFTSPSMLDGEVDHPLNPDPESRWQAFFKDNEVLLQIDKDVRRLCPDISFFQQPTEYPNMKIVGAHSQVERLHQRVHQSVLSYGVVIRKGVGITSISAKKPSSSSDYLPLSEGQEAHWEVVERVLFLYAKLNPGQGYVQGMNEIIGPIYYCFASDPNKEWAEFAEADTFFCFTNLMSEIRDFFIKSLDESNMGINQLMLELMQLLDHHDHELWLKFQELELKPEFFSFRWLTLLLSQEFPLPDVIRIWDSLFTHDKRFQFLLLLCCAMILLQRNSLLSGDFPSNMKLLQNYPPTDVQIIVNKAAILHKKYHS